MKAIIYFFSVTLILSSCKNDSNPIITDPPNPYAQKEIDWPSLQKAPWPMYRHDPQLTGRSQYAGPSKGIIADTIKLWSNATAVISNEENAYLAFSFDTTADICSYNAKYKSINWKLKLPANFIENPNTPIILSNGNILYSGKLLYSISKDGSLVGEFSTVKNEIINPLTQIDKYGNIYIIESQILYCISPAMQVLWNFTFPGLWQPKLAFSPDGKTLYIPLAYGNSLLAFDVEQQSIKWTFGTMPLFAAPIVDNLGNLYFQKSSDTAEIDTFYCLNKNGDVRWYYVYHKGNQNNNPNEYREPTIDGNGNIYFIAHKDTLVSVANDGSIRWKLPLQRFQGSFSPLVCDANNTIFMTTGDNHVLAVAQSGTILWQIKLNLPNELYNTPSIMNGKLIITANSGNIYIIE
jgi:hypothetical protein